ncbi:YHS domain-containing protein [Tistlia consotensis]|uniref:YHS domain-containing protein n=1 Tax=Tistlia consotensis USBA 355 TaxID=560819 RepID=A0A1Y6BVN2_9PROT|nr:YHS domain-containing protein [Tistlia consotensis]SMF27470.1 YHS domain-containing protein [Tistlia consotensis USBA 355]SNR66033.1 YHS domain-containing protein [Tistlia consotensis]
MEALIYFALWAGLIFLMMRVGCGAHVMGHGHDHGAGAGKASAGSTSGVRWVPPETDVDPVCGKTVHPDKAKPSVHDGMVYYFCSRECRELFEAAPQLYVGPQAARQPEMLEHHHD